MNANPTAISWWCAPEGALKAYGKLLHSSAAPLSVTPKAICHGAALMRRGDNAAHRRGSLLASSHAAERTSSSTARCVMQAQTPNPSVNRTARKLRLRDPSALRAPAAGYLKR